MDIDKSTQPKNSNGGVVDLTSILLPTQQATNEEVEQDNDEKE